jgi:hypothetical protein
MNLNIVEYLDIWVYVNIIMWIPVWISYLRILYEFEFENSLVCFGRFKCILNLWLLNGVDWLKVADTLNMFFVFIT